MEDMDWYGYEDEVTGEWICSLVVVYDPALSKMPKQRWHRALDKINKVILLTSYIFLLENVSWMKPHSNIKFHCKKLLLKDEKLFTIFIAIIELSANSQNLECKKFWKI